MARNPLTLFLYTIVTAIALALIVGIPILLIPASLIPYVELKVIILAFVAFGLGIAAGRTSLLGSMGFVGAFVGGFFGYLILQYLLLPTGWEFPLALGLGALCGAGGWVTGKLGLRRVEKEIQAAQSLGRRCAKCGAKVGVVARKCWSCRAYLPVR